MDTEQKEKILAECRELMAKGKYDDSKTNQFCDTVGDILQFAIDNPDEEREVQYKIKKHIDRIEFRVDAARETGKINKNGETGQGDGEVSDSV